MVNSRFGTKAGIFTVALASFFALLLIAAAPAFAGHHGGGSNDSGYTEDNDTNDGNTSNNVSDPGDNKHPSGKDRSVEKGGSGNQGKSGSDPDGDSNGGPDKPNGSGGSDKADQDGNNGCGNDDDFEDDNNGNCGPKDQVRGSRADCPATAAMAGKSGKSKKAKKSNENASKNAAKCHEDEDEGEVRGTRTTNVVEDDDDKFCPADEIMGSSTMCGPSAKRGAVEGGSIDEVNNDVLGTRVSRGATSAAVDRGAPATDGKLLPFTGAALLGLIALAIGLIGSGLLFWRRTHR